MDEGIRRLELELNPAHLASTIDNAVVISSEIVNFHFSALASADLTQPAKAADARYRFQTPAISAADRRAMQECWILAKAFQELLRAVRHSLEEAYVFVALLTGKHKIKSSATLSECQKPFKSKAGGLRFPDLLDAVNDKLDPKIDFLPPMFRCKLQGTVWNTVTANAGALTSMMARSTTRSNQRPDTLMQDRKADRSLIPLATRGRTIELGQSRQIRCSDAISARLQTAATLLRSSELAFRPTSGRALICCAYFAKVPS